MGFHKFVNMLYGMCISGECVGPGVMAKLLDSDISLSDALYLRECAYRAALIVTGGKAYLWGMLEACYMPYFMSASIRADRKPGSSPADNTMADIIGFHKEKGVSSIVLNMYEDTGKHILPEKIAEIKNRTDCACKVAVRAGKRHMLNNAENALAYMYKKTADESKVEFMPVIKFECRAYSDYELAEILFNALAKQQDTSCIVLDFTECRNRGIFSDERIAQITAVMRLASGGQIKNICVCPDIKKTSISGANAAIVSVGGNTSDLFDKNEHNIKTVFYKAGYNV